MKKYIGVTPCSGNQNGSVLFIILIAVTLFAALSYTVASMMRGPSDIGDESAGIYASDILTYAQSIREAVHMMRISNGCTEDQISFERAPFDGSDAAYVNAASPADFACHVFHPGGGGVGEQAPLAEVNNGVEWLFTGHNRVPNVGNDATSDLAMIIPDISHTICLRLNEKLDIGLVSGDAPADTDGANSTKFTGTYASPAQISTSANLGKGKMEGCYKDESPNPDTYNFYQVLLAR